MSLLYIYIYTYMYIYIYIYMFTHTLLVAFSSRQGHDGLLHQGPGYDRPVT